MTIRQKNINLSGPGADERVKCIGCQKEVPAKDTALAKLVKLLGEFPAPAVCDECFVCPRCGNEKLRVDVRFGKEPGKQFSGDAYAWGCPNCQANWPGNVKGVLVFTAEVSQSMVKRAMMACEHFPEVGPGCDGDCPASDACPALRSFEACDHRGKIDQHCGMCPARKGCEPGGLPEQLLEAGPVDFARAAELLRTGGRDPSKAN